MIIGLTGESGAGKDTAAEYLKGRGFSYHSLSDILREECQKISQETNRDNLIAMGNRLRAEFGPSILAKKILEKISATGGSASGGKDNHEENSLVVSIRNPAEVVELKKELSFKLISVVAPLEIRYQRISGRGRPEDRVSLEKFKEQEEREMAGSENEQQLRKVMAMADYTVSNGGTVKELEEQINNYVH